KVLLGLEKLLTSVAEAEAAQRAYLLTGEPSELEPYRAAVERLPKQVKRLKELTAQSKRLPALDAAVAQVVSEMNRFVELRRVKAVEPVAAFQSSKKLTDELRKVVTSMKEEEEKLLRERMKAP